MGCMTRFGTRVLPQLPSKSIALFPRLLLQLAFGSSTNVLKNPLSVLALVLRRLPFQSSVYRLSGAPPTAFRVLRYLPLDCSAELPFEASTPNVGSVTNKPNVIDCGSPSSLFLSPRRKPTSAVRRSMLLRCCGFVMQTRLVSTAGGFLFGHSTSQTC